MSIVMKFRILCALTLTMGMADLGVGAELNDPPQVQLQLAREVARGITIIPDPRVNFVPNVGIIEGRNAVLVVDTGLGPENGRRVAEFARKIAGQRRIYLTATHFHPEHSFGAEGFPEPVTFILNDAQAKERAEKGGPFLELFRTFGPDVEAALRDVRLVAPDETYERERSLDLGGRTVLLRAMPAHTRGDQVVFVPDAGVIFLGDLVENRFIPILPDQDAHGAQWIEVTRKIEALKPKIVVPGHGELAGPELIGAVREYLERVQSAVDERVKQGRSQEEITRELTPRLKAQYATWDNAVFIPNSIAVFYAEATHRPLQLPSLEQELGSP